MAKVGNRENAFFAHEAHGFLAELVAMVDGYDTRLSRVERSWLTGSVHRDAFSYASGLANRGLQLGFRVLIRRRKFAIDE